MDDPTQWWPAPVRHVGGERPWDELDVVVAEIRSFDERPDAGYRSTLCVLVPKDEAATVEAHLACVAHEVSTSGPRPSPSARPYVPTFAVEAFGALKGKYESLVQSWTSHDKTVLVPDQGFLMTYGLVPRATSDGWIAWDEVTKPEPDVVRVSPASSWDFPLASGARVTIRRDYLQDYLSLRHMVLVQVYYEQRFGIADAEITAALGDDEVTEIDLADREIHIHRQRGKATVGVAVSGGRIVAHPGAFPVSGDSLEEEGLLWPGFEKPVTKRMALRMGTMDFVYVSDDVLAEFENKPVYRIVPKHGSVRLGTQWSVSHCDRVGRDLIRLELKKLYEGVPQHITRHWNRFVVPPVPMSAYPAILETRNIAARTEELVAAVLDLGDALSSLSHQVGQSEPPETFVGLRRGALRYSGWWTFPDLARLACHVPLGMSVEAFLKRCSDLSQIVVEGLAQSRLRRLVAACEVPNKVTETMGTLKLLDLVVKLSQVSHETGLLIRKSAAEIWTRLDKNGTKPKEPVAELFALYDLRNLAAHLAPDRDARVLVELARFGLAAGDIAAGYGMALDRLYDTLKDRVAEAAGKIREAAA